MGNIIKTLKHWLEKILDGFFGHIGAAIAILIGSFLGSHIILQDVFENCAFNMNINDPILTGIISSFLAIAVISLLVLIYKSIKKNLLEKFVNRDSESCCNTIEPGPFCFNNDTFASNTILSRFPNNIGKLEKYYYEALDKLKIAGNNIFPFEDSILRRSKFCRPQNLYERLTPSQRIILDKFYDKHKEYFKKDNAYFFHHAPFIEAEHHFYFFILNIFYGLDPKIQAYMSGIEEYPKDKHPNEKVIYDPYKLIKKQSIIDDLSKEKNSIILKCLSLIKTVESQYDIITLKNIIELSLNSNSCDLSQADGRNGTYIDEDKIFPNHISDIVQFLISNHPTGDWEINYLVDNSGVEFFADLAFASMVLSDSSYHVSNVVLHVNVLPIFVSDVIESDYQFMMDIIDNKVGKDPLYSIGLETIKTLYQRGKNNLDKSIKIVPNFIWNMPTPYKEISNNSLFTAKNSIVVVKGDLNYRRLAEDRAWDYTTKLEELTKNYITCPTFVIRSIKSSLVLDYTKEKYNEREENDSAWKAEGNYGVIQLLNGHI